ncbi:MAG TPA: hypothetical protein VF006_04380 [Longimicrobium sp.]
MTITAPAATPSTAVAQHAFRRSILEPEKTYTLYPDRLEIRGEGSPPEVHALAQVEKVHLKYDRSKQRAYYNCFIHTPGRRVSLRHVHFGGIGRFQDRRESYTPFVRALLQAVARQNPHATLRAGSLFNFVMCIILLPLLAGVGLLAFTLNSWAGALGMAFLALMCISMIPRSRPRTVDPADPPANVLP